VCSSARAWCPHGGDAPLTFFVLHISFQSLKHWLRSRLHHDSSRHRGSGSFLDVSCDLYLVLVLILGQSTRVRDHLPPFTLAAIASVIFLAVLRLKGLAVRPRLVRLRRSERAGALWVTFRLLVLAGSVLRKCFFLISVVHGAGRYATPIRADVPTSVFATVTPLEGETIEQQKMIVRTVTKSIEPHYVYPHSDTTK
jgi:hypothetical protein